MQVKTFSNTSGGSALFKALGHPLTCVKMNGLIKELSLFKKIAVYDPLGQAAEWEELYDLTPLKVSNVLVQNVNDITKKLFGLNARFITDLKNIDADAVFVAAFDSARLIAQIHHLLPKDVKVFSFDDVRLADEFITNARNYLDPLNFATNFVFFREESGHHTQLVTANYWGGYSSKKVGLWCCLFDKDGGVLAQWNEKLGGTVHSITIDSIEVCQRFNIQAFTGSLFIHFTGIAGYDVVKYVLDTYGNDDSVLSCTHDANSWPADLYAGLPAPRDGERVLLWVQNSHPCPIPADGIGLSQMGSDRVGTYEKQIPGFATRAIDVVNLVPGAKWPQQIEVHAGRHFVRPRYEIIDGKGRRLIAHTNVERTDLQADPAIRMIGKEMGKGYILPAPILPLGRFRNIILPTPMSTCQENLPLTLIVYNSQGEQAGKYALGKLDRGHIKDINVNELLGSRSEHDFPGGFGHMELVYDFSQGGDADGWLHALMRYEDTKSGHNTETSFGSHIFNTVLVYKNEPQSYTGKPPGLSTRLFLRLGNGPTTDTLCHLIYPASTAWHAESRTELTLFDQAGTEILKKTVSIACSGSLLWRYHEMFSKEERQRAGQGAYIIIRDTSCRLFGYHGLIKGERSFSLDHMFGF